MNAGQEAVALDGWEGKAHGRYTDIFHVKRMSMQSEDPSYNEPYAFIPTTDLT